MALQSKTIAVGNLQDDTSGNNYAVNKAVYILKLDKSLQPIFLDYEGTMPITQDGVNNVTDQYGEFTFFVEAGDYIARVGGRESKITVTGNDYFDNRIDETVNAIVQQVANREINSIVGSFEGGFTYTDVKQLGSYGTAPNIDYYVFTGGIDDLPHTVAAATNPQSNDLYAKSNYNSSSNVANDDGTTAQDTYDSLQEAITKLSYRPVYATDHGVIGDGSDETSKLQDAIDEAYALGRNMVKCSGLTITITEIILKSVVLDLEGGTIQKLAGYDITKQMITAGQFGSSNTQYDNSGVINGTVLGNGVEDGLSDQGAGIAFYQCNNFLVHNVVTDNTNGDGIATRSANGIISNVVIKTFGRNGISPTSGVISYYDVDIMTHAAPIAGANPGSYFDSEINNNTEVSEHYLHNVKSKGLTFVDLKATEGQDYAVKVRMSGCTVGGAFRALRFQSSQKTVNADIKVDSTNTIICEADSGSDNTGIEINNVSGVNIDAATVLSSGAGTQRLVKIVGEVSNLTLNGTKLPEGNFAVDCSGGGVLNNSTLNLEKPARIYIEGSNNVVKAVEFSRIDVNGASSQGNVFHAEYEGSFDFNLTGGAEAIYQKVIGLQANPDNPVMPQSSILGNTRSQRIFSGAATDISVKIDRTGIYRVIALIGSDADSYAIGDWTVHCTIGGNLTVLVEHDKVNFGSSSVSDPTAIAGVITVNATADSSSVATITVIG